MTPMHMYTKHSLSLLGGDLWLCKVGSRQSPLNAPYLAVMSHFRLVMTFFGVPKDVS
jgi:hypothetical protein